jgi:AcrR family transcriptional regulator
VPVVKKQAQAPRAPHAAAARTRAPRLSTEERILEGAARAFGKLGYAAVRVEDILLEAKVSRPTFYKLYGTKEEVFQTLSERHHREIRELIRQVPRAKTSAPLAILEGMVSVFLHWRAALGPVGRVLDTEARTPGSCIAAERQKTLREMTALMNELLTLHGRKPVDPVLIVALIAGLESVADALLSNRRSDPAALAHALRLALRLVGATIAGPDDAVPPLPTLA